MLLLDHLYNKKDPVDILENPDGWNKCKKILVSSKDMKSYNRQELILTGRVDKKNIKWYEKLKILL